MEFKFASRRQLSFIINAGGRNLLVSFGARNQAGVSVFMTKDPKVAQAIRRHSLTRRKIIEETTSAEDLQAAASVQVAIPATKVPGTERSAKKPTAETVAEAVADATHTVAETAGESEEREYDNYTVARESICKEFGVKKELVRNPTALARVAKEHGIIIRYKEK